MGYISGMNRAQVLRFPESVDEDIEENTPVRCIEAYVDRLDLTTLGFTQAVPKETGRPGYTPAALLKLYMYGYLHQIRSRRKLAQETHRTVELMWLLRQLTPDFKTIADVRKDNAGALKEVCREFTLLCKKLDLFGRELIAIDGSKFTAVHSKNRHFTESKLKQLLQHIHEKIDTYLKELDQPDTLESSVRTPTADELKGNIAQRQSRRQHDEDLRQQLDVSGASQISLTDPDSRSMKTKHGTDVCDHVQVAVDHQHNLIVEHEVTNDVTDQDQLAAMATRAKDTLDTDRVDALADRGYDHGDEVKKCLDEGIVPSIPKPNTSANSTLGRLGKEDFTDDPQHDGDSCPAGQVFTFRFETVERGRPLRYYSTSACQGCPIKSPCTRNKGHRSITRWVHESLLDDRQPRVLTNPEKVKWRKSLVEPPVGTMKRWMDQGYFLTRGLENVRGDMSLTSLVYHRKRVINIIGVKDVIAAVG
jgi:transposase